MLPIYSSQGENLSSIEYQINRKDTQLTDQITHFRWTLSWTPAQILKEADITSKINSTSSPTLKKQTILNTVSSLGVYLGSILFITFFF
jgi:predicted PurR-regulated permease PerM